MFVYLIIAIELTVLYVVFWIVFLREPRPREIRAELWGSYSKSNKQAPQDVPQPQQSIIDHTQFDFYVPSTLPRAYRISRIKKARRKRILARRSGRQNQYCQICCRIGHSQYVHRQMLLPQQASRTVVEKFLLSLNRVLNKLSVKVP